MSEPEVVEDFYGVYLLYCLNPKYKGRTYIGYTRDPNRRIMQHNRGTWAGGAYKTNNKGPWKMVMIIHGFPNNISALRFEWAWQNPATTVRLKHLNLKKIPRKESEFKFKLRVLSEMLRVGPWCRLPLVIRWLELEYREEFPVITNFNEKENSPPTRRVIVSGMPKAQSIIWILYYVKFCENFACKIQDLVHFCVICKESLSLLSTQCHLCFLCGRFFAALSCRALGVATVLTSRPEVDLSDGPVIDATGGAVLRASHADRAVMQVCGAGDRTVVLLRTVLLVTAETIERKPPDHMTICQGLIKSKNLKRRGNVTQVSNEECLLCSNYITRGQTQLTCLNPSCELVAHIACIADIFLAPGEYVPIEGSCPFCSTKLKWGDLIRRMKGCLLQDIESAHLEEDQNAVQEEECSDEEIQKKEFVDEPSWFLDCNYDL